MRVVYFFTSNGAAAPDQIVPWTIENQATNYYANSIWTEGFFWMFKRMIEESIVDEVLIVIESVRGPGSVTYNDNLKVIVVPHISKCIPFLKEGDVFFVRGGFKSWYAFLTEYHNKGTWIVFYRANTNRGPWPFWDVVLDDLVDSTFIENNKLHLPFIKPTNEELFHPMPEVQKEYDLCIGSSHVHDKKGQWEAIKMLIEYKKIFGKSLNCILPGSISRGVHTNEIRSDIINNELIVELPGMVQRDEVRTILNKSRLLIKLGGGGQGDRGPLEALACGTEIILAETACHAPFMYQNPEVCLLTKNRINLHELSIEVRRRVNNAVLAGKKRRSNVYKYYLEKSGMNEVVLPQMSKLISILSKTAYADRTYLQKEYLL